MARTSERAAAGGGRARERILNHGIDARTMSSALRPIRSTTMERQQAFTVLGATGAAAAATATLLFLWLPAEPRSDAPPGSDEMAALRREVALLKDELAARPAP